MNFFRRKVKCKRFYKANSRTLDITGLKAGIPEKFDFGLGSFKLDTKYNEVDKQLQQLDLLQYGLCNDINAVENSQERDQLLKKIVDAKTRMLEIAMGVLSNPDSQFDYLTETDLINLLLNFHSDAFTTPFQLEESLIKYKKRIADVCKLLEASIEKIHPDYKRYIIEIFSLVKTLKRISSKFTDYTYYIPWQPESLTIDIIRFSLVFKVNSLLNSLGAPDKISSKRFLKDSYLVKEFTNRNSESKQRIFEELKQVKDLFEKENLDPNYVLSFEQELEKHLS